MTAFPKQKYTLEEYFEIERQSKEKYEYFDGNIRSTAGAIPETRKNCVQRNLSFTHDSGFSAKPSRMNGRIFSPTFNVEILVAEIYLDVEFPEPPTNFFLVNR